MASSYNKGHGHKKYALKPGTTPFGFDGGKFAGKKYKPGFPYPGEDIPAPVEDMFEPAEATPPETCGDDPIRPRRPLPDPGDADKTPKKGGRRGRRKKKGGEK